MCDAQNENEQPQQSACGQTIYNESIDHRGRQPEDDCEDSDTVMAKRCTPETEYKTVEQVEKRLIAGVYLVVKCMSLKERFE